MAGKMVVDNQGRAVDCPTCPCGGTKPCCATTFPLTMYAYWRTAGNTPSGGPDPGEYFHACMTLTYVNRPDHPGGEHWWTGTATIGAFDSADNEYFTTEVLFEMVCWTNAVPPASHPFAAPGVAYYRMKQYEDVNPSNIVSQVGNFDDALGTGTYGLMSDITETPLLCVTPCFGPDVVFAGLSAHIDVTGSNTVCTEQVINEETIQNHTLTFEGTFIVDEVPTLLSCTLYYTVCGISEFGVANGTGYGWAGSIIVDCAEAADESFRVGVVYDAVADEWSLYIRSTIWTGPTFPFSGTTDPFDRLCVAGDPEPVLFSIA